MTLKAHLGQAVEKPPPLLSSVEPQEPRGPTGTGRKGGPLTCVQECTPRPTLLAPAQPGPKESLPGPGWLGKVFRPPGQRLWEIPFQDPSIPLRQGSGGQKGEWVERESRCAGELAWKLQNPQTPNRITLERCHFLPFTYIL